jgi:hypothetical protein
MVQVGEPIGRSTLAGMIGQVNNNNNDLGAICAIRVHAVLKSGES